MNNPNYYAIIPANVRYNKELSFLEKFLYCEVTALSNLNGYCTAKNQYFSELYDKDKATISRAISHLEELQFIHIEYEKSGAKVEKRRIFPLDIKNTNDKIVNGTETTNDKNVTREQEKLLATIDKIVKENNSSYEDIIKIIIVSLRKDKKETDALSCFEFSEKSKEAISKWLEHKAEKKQSYKETGLKTLLKKLYEWQKGFGSEYVVDAIENSITMNYSGIFPRNEKHNKTPYSEANKKYLEENRKYLSRNDTELF